MPNDKNEHRYDAEYFASHCGSIPYDRAFRHWLEFFGRVADEIVRKFAPRNVLDVGCAKGFLVESFRDRGLEAYGFDLSEYAISQVRDDIRPYCWVASATDPIKREYDLITCIEVLEHVSESEARHAIENMAGCASRILFSSTPYDLDEPTHINVRPISYWVDLFAEYSLYPNIGADMGFVSPQAMFFCKSEKKWQDSVLDLYVRTIEQKVGLHQNQQSIQDLSSRLAEKEESSRLSSAQLDQKDQAIRALSSQLAEKEMSSRLISAQLDQKEQTILALSSKLEDAKKEQTCLSQIQSSHGWRFLQLYYQLRDKLLAARSRRRNVLKFIWRVATRQPVSKQIISSGSTRRRQLRDHLGHRIANKSDSLFWRLRSRVRPHRDRCFPLGTGRRTVCDRLLAAVKRAYFARISEFRSRTSEGMLASARGMEELQATPEAYRQWIHANEPDLEQLAQQRKLSLKFSYRPLISIVMPTWNPPVEVFEDTLGSVLDQTYDNWELCIAGGSSENIELVLKLTNLSKKDARIRVNFANGNLGISGNSNEALKLAKGEFIALLDHDDSLAPSALYEVTRLLNERPELDFIYTDKDLLSADGSMRFDPLFKPGWSPEIMLSANYLTHLCVIRKEAVDRAGGWRSETDGAQDWDLFLRVLDDTDRIAHIPHVLYHWRALHGSAATGIEAKPYAFQRQLKVIEEHLRKSNIRASASFTTSGPLRVIWSSEQKRVSIIIPNRDAVDLLRPCLDTLLNKTAYKNFEVLIIENGSNDLATFRFYDELEHLPNVQILKYQDPFNYSAVNNFGAAHATGDILLFLNNDTEIIDPQWLEELARWAERQEIGVVGPKLLKTDNLIQHAGVIVGLTGFAGHVFAGLPEGHLGLFGSTEWYRNYLAVTGACLMVRRQVFYQVGGFNEEFKLCGSDVEFCLRVRKNGYRVVYTPFAKLLHHESATRGTSIPRVDFDTSLRSYEPYLSEGDPFFNRNLSYWNTIPQLRLGPEQTPLEFAHNFLQSKGEEYSGLAVVPEIARTPGAIPSPRSATPPVPSLLQRLNWAGKAFIKSRLEGSASRRPSLWSRYSSDATLLATWLDFTEEDLVASLRVTSNGHNGEDLRSVNWFIPDFDHAAYGGIHTILRFAAYLKRTRNVQNRFVVLGQVLPAKIRDAVSGAFPELANEDVIIGASDVRSHQLPEADACIATLWTTAYSVLKFNRTKRKFYFIQDFEPLFYPAGSTAAQVEATYRFGFYGIANTRPLKEIYEGQYGGKAEFFNPCVDGKIFHPDGPRHRHSKLRIFFYGRPEHPRNAFELGAATLRKVKQRFGNDVEIVTAGARWQPKDFQLEGVVENLGLMPYHETAKLYRSCDVGLLLMFTRHPSYIPLELMASGCVVVSNSNPATAWLMQDGSNCMLTKPSAGCLSEAISKVILDAETREHLRKNALRHVCENYSDWESQIEKIFEFMCNPERQKAVKTHVGGMA